MNEINEKEALKQLREARGETIAKARQTIKAQNRDFKQIRGFLQQGARTVPEIAAAVGMSTSQVMQYVAGMKKYGLLVEGAKQDDYYTYELAK